MKNIYLLPSQNNKSKLATYCYDESKNIKVGELGLQINNTVGWTNCWSEIELYITSEEEIKTGDWYYNHKTDTVQKRTKDTNNESYIGFKKVILTTDRDLIKDGVQTIPDEFLKWFIKNPSCERVETENLKSDECNCYYPKFCKSTMLDAKTHCGEGAKIKNYYKITIPKEEPKQERSYSEEEVWKLVNKLNETLNIGSDLTLEKWFEQFKKK